MRSFLKALMITLLCFAFIIGIVCIYQGVNEMKKVFTSSDSNDSESESNVSSESSSSIHVEYDLSGENSAGTSKLLEHYMDSCDDVVARMYIPDTGMETPIVDTEYYFRRNLAGEYDTNGTPYMNGTSNFMKANRNTIIYGHRLVEKEDFGMLRDYVSQDFYEEHPQIYIETPSGETTWNIISVFTINVATDSFSYIDYTDLSNTTNRDTFMSEIKSRNILDIPSYTYQEDDQFITLSTCHYETDTENGRLVVVAVRN